MPKSKRAKVVHLSRTRPKTKEHTVALYNSIRAAAASYPNILVFSVDNMRNTYLKDLRTELESSRIFFAKTKVMAKALGTTEEEEALPGLSQLSSYLTGSVGLLFTHQNVDDVLEFLDGYSKMDFARAGIEATRTFTVPAGIVYSRAGEIPTEEDVPLAHSMESTLRAWGMPTSLTKGKVTLDAPFTVCTEGQILNSHQTALLKMFGITMAEFKLQVRAYYNATTKEVTEIEAEV